MVATRSTPPDLHTLDADALRAMIVAQHGQVQAPIEQLRARDHPIERLRRLIAKLQRMQFGRKPEKVERQIEPLELKLEELETNRAESAPVIEQPAAVSTPAPATRPARRSLPEHLPRALETHEPEQPCCPECGGVPSKLGEDVSEVLEYIPESFQVIRHLRPKLSCTACDGIVRRRHHHARWSAASQGPRCSPACSPRSTVIISRCTARTRAVVAKRRSGRLDAGRLGWRIEPVGATAGRGAAPLCARWRQAARR